MFVWKIPDENFHGISFILLWAGTLFLAGLPLKSTLRSLQFSDKPDVKGGQPQRSPIIVANRRKLP
ncbi:MAG: hypothetical protein Q4C22_07585, partial [Bacillota bacterium]|nr:hypothetical protein [Bacillota bacterium]